MQMLPLLQVEHKYKNNKKGKKATNDSRKKNLLFENNTSIKENLTVF